MTTTSDAKWLQATAIAAFLAVSAPAALAQGLENPDAIDTIIGSEVKEEAVPAGADPARLIAAIDASVENATKIRKVSSLEKVDIVRLAEADGKAPPPEIDAKVKEREPEIAALREELEGNAMLFHAIDSRSILLRDVVAVEFDDANGVIIYALGAAPTTPSP